MESHRLTVEEHRAFREGGFFFREAAFSREEVAELADAAERADRRVAAAAQGRAPGYWIDGNRYAELEGTTVQFEHREGSETIRVLEPFHHLDDGFERLLDDPRIVEPMRELIGSERISLSRPTGSSPVPTSSVASTSCSRWIELPRRTAVCA
jgi:hypothetical protein